jgi:hypothetical protein
MVQGVGLCFAAKRYIMKKFLLSTVFLRQEKPTKSFVGDEHDFKSERSKG